MHKLIYIICLVFFTTACDNSKAPITEENTKKEMEVNFSKDPHSFSEPLKARVKHLNLNVDVDFDNKIISGTAEYLIEHSEDAIEIILDTKGLLINSTNVDGVPTDFVLEKPDSILGTALRIPIKGDSKSIQINYSTTEEAEALQWLNPKQTAGKKLPFLFTQSQAILARTWIPCQDGPGIRFTYNAIVRVPKEMLALMSAVNPQEKNETGEYTFKMEQPIPSYLMALAAGDIVFKPVGNRTGVYAEPSLIDASVYEFADMEAMLEGAEELYGPYAWERYDLIVLPPSFPFGGMENPRLTFATPTILAGDRSLTALVAHELAHSWSGNLVTNAIWDDFWLNEGFTVYFEQRIMEALYGRELSEMLALLSYDGLLEEIEHISAERPADTHLKLDLKGRNPDDGLTAIAYDKGYLFLRMLEESYGREKFDSFLRNYFKENKFKIMTTEAFMDYLDTELLSTDEAAKSKAMVDKWVYGEGLPENCPVIKSDKLVNVEGEVASWMSGDKSLAQIDTSAWTYQQWQHLIRTLPKSLDVKKLANLDEAFGFTKTGNNEVLAEWLVYATLNKYEGVEQRVEDFLMVVGRRKFLKPVYKAIKDADGNTDRALMIYAEARENYHAVSVNTLDEMLGYAEAH